MAAREFAVYTTAVFLVISSIPVALATEPAPSLDDWRRDLGSNSYEVREKAMRELCSAGTLAQDAVRVAAVDADREVSLRAFRILGVWTESSDAEKRKAAETVLESLALHVSPRVASDADRLLSRFAEAALRRLTELGVSFDEAHESATFADAWKGERGDLALLRKIPSVKQVRLVGTEVDDAWVGSLRGSSLERLDLSGTSVTDEGLAGLADLPRLKSLNLNETFVTEDGIAHLANAPSLESLALDGVPIRGPALDELKKLPQLRELRISRTRIASGDFSTIRDFPRLQTLDVRQTKFSYDDLLDVAESPMLRLIHARSSRITEVDAEDFQREKPDSPIELRFEHHGVGDRPAHDPLAP